MSAPPRSSFFALPSLGGKLTIVNLNCWVIFFLIARSEVLPPLMPLWLEFAVVSLLFVLAMPLGLCIPLWSGPYQPVSMIVLSAVILAANAFVWGYGLAWIIHLVQAAYRKWREPRPGRRLPKHFPPLDDVQS